MRIGEVVVVGRGNLGLDAGVITVREAKFDRSRLVRLHPTTTEALHRYATERNRLCPRPCSSAFFLSSTGTQRLARITEITRTLQRITRDRTRALLFPSPMRRESQTTLPTP